MKQVIPFAFFAIIAFVMFSKFTKNTSSNNPANAPQSSDAVADKQAIQLTEKWPPVTEETVKDVLQENYLVVLDDSGSMKKANKMQQALQALETLSDTLPSTHNLGLICLNSRISVPLGSNNRDEFKNALRKIPANGSTPLTRATRRGIEKITAQASKQKGYGNYHLIIVTDGESSDGNPTYEVRSATMHTAIQVHVIGFHLNNHSLNIQGIVDYQTASNADELAKAFKQVAAETDTFSDPTEFIQ